MTGDEGQRRWRQRPSDLSWREIDDELIVLDLRSASYLRLNPSAGFLWGQLAPGVTLPQLAASLADRFEIDAERARADATQFLDSCSMLGLVESEEPER